MLPFTLILHHIENIYEDHFEDLYLERLTDYIGQHHGAISRIVHTAADQKPLYLQSHKSNKADQFEELWRTITHYHIPVVTLGWDYGPYEESDWAEPWGDGPCPLGDCIQVSSHHRYTYIYPWMRQLGPLSGRIKLAGGARYECLLDFQESLEHLGIRFNTEHSLVFG